MTLLERLRSRPIPFAELMDVTFLAAEPDKVVATMLVREEFCTIYRTIHGGAVMALADSVGAAATLINLPEGATTTTIESKTNFVASAPAGSMVRATATPVHKGRRTQVWQTRVETEQGRLLALVTQTQLIIEKS